MVQDWSSSRLQIADCTFFWVPNYSSIFLIIAYYRLHEFDIVGCWFHIGKCILLFNILGSRLQIVDYIVKMLWLYMIYLQNTSNTYIVKKSLNINEIFNSHQNLLVYHMIIFYHELILVRNKELNIEGSNRFIACVYSTHEKDQTS